MKITAVTAPGGIDFGQNAAFKIVCDTLKELGESVNILNLANLSLPYYDGIIPDAAHEAMQTIKDADGLVISAPAYFSAPAAMLMSFMEYFENDGFKPFIEDKNCLLLSVSGFGGEKTSLDILAGTLSSLNAFDVVRIGLNTSVASVVKSHVIELIERQSEDFYRILRQNRKYIRAHSPRQIYSADFSSAADVSSVKKAPVSIDDLYKKHSLDDFTETAQTDISKLSSLFAQKLGESPDNSNSDSVQVPGNLTAASANSFARPANAAKSVKQLTSSLPHYFNPQLAKDLSATFQLNITGHGGFTGYLTINKQNCDFTEGETERNDILVIAESSAWSDVLKKKVTAQKAFMMGQLKVRGNFVLLTKFDQLFNKIQ